MIKIRLIIFIILLLLLCPGCLVRYGEDRLNQLLMSVNNLQRVCVENDEKLTEEKIKEKLGKPGWLKPVYEHNLDFTLLKNLKKDSGVLLIPNREGLYNDMLIDIKKKRLKRVRLLSYIYDRMGHEDASFTFYIGNYRNEETPIIIGWDYVKYSDYEPIEKDAKMFVNYKIEKPVDYLRLPYTFLIDTIIGLKQFAGEIVKSPVSFIESEFFENIFNERKIPFYKFEGFKAAIEDWHNGITALTYRYRIDGKQGILATTQNLIGEVPVIGSIFDQWYKKEIVDAKRLFLTRGIYGSDNSAQNTALWEHFFIEQKESIEFSVKAIPYRYGSTVDVLWSMLNISHGFAYDMASEIVINNNIKPGDSIHLCGHSGGVQRIVSTARILNDDGISVEKMFGITGPALGYIPCNKIEVELNGKILQDSTSDVSRLLNYLTLNLLTNIKWKYNKDVDESYKHRTPGFVDGRTRLKYDGFLSENLKDFFR